jgi:hypothetical protein
MSTGFQYQLSSMSGCSRCGFDGLPSNPALQSDDHLGRSAPSVGRR